MVFLVTGATGATGRILVRQLLDRGHSVRAIVRTPAAFLDAVAGPHDHLTVIEAPILDLTANDLASHTRGCTAVASCLGHNMTLQGLFGQPRRLVTEATRRLCAAIAANAPERPVRFVLMNTTGNRNRDLEEPVSFAERCLMGVMRRVLPPHADNEQAAEHLRTRVGRDDAHVEWAAVRPDNLVDADAVTDYEIHPSPTRSAIFDPGRTSRVNVAHFMAELMTDDAVWEAWKGRMPVIYNAA